MMRSWHVFIRLTQWQRKFPFQSPYLYASNNPVRFIDYKGLYTNEPRQGAAESNRYDQWGSYIFPNQRGQTRYEILYQEETEVVEEPKPQGQVAQSDENGDNRKVNNTATNDLADDVAFASGLWTTMVSEATRGLNTPLLKTIGKTAVVLGGVTGTIDNAAKAANAFSEGSYMEGTFQSVQAGSYAVGTIMLFTPLAPAGAIIIGVNTAIDIGEYFYSKW
jgi:hypothetical protein